MGQKMIKKLLIILWIMCASCSSAIAFNNYTIEWKCIICGNECVSPVAPEMKCLDDNWGKNHVWEFQYIIIYKSISDEGCWDSD